MMLWYFKPLNSRGNSFAGKKIIYRNGKATCKTINIIENQTIDCKINSNNFIV